MATGTQPFSAEAQRDGRLLFHSCFKLRKMCSGTQRGTSALLSLLALHPCHLLFASTGACVAVLGARKTLIPPKTDLTKQLSLVPQCSQKMGPRQERNEQRGIPFSWQLGWDGHKAILNPEQKL